MSEGCGEGLVRMVMKERYTVIFFHSKNFFFFFFLRTSNISFTQRIFSPIYGGNDSLPCIQSGRSSVFFNLIYKSIFLQGDISVKFITIQISQGAQEENPWEVVKEHGKWERVTPLLSQVNWQNSVSWPFLIASEVGNEAQLCVTEKQYTNFGEQLVFLLQFIKPLFKSMYSLLFQL